MQIYPSVEISNEQCRKIKPYALRPGFPQPQTAEQTAKYWMEQGATAIHLVDIDGIKTGHIVSTAAIKETAYAIPVPLQLYGGIRSLNDIEFVIHCGVRRAVLGTKAMMSPGFIRQAVTLFSPAQLVVSVRVSDGRLVVNDRETGGFETLLNYCMQMRKMRIKSMIFHDISPNGVMSGRTLELLGEISDITGMEVTVSGKILSLKDLEIIHGTGIHGVVLDDAIYEGKIQLREAIKLFSR